MTQCLLCYMIFQLVNYRSNSFQRRLRKPVIEWIKLRWRKLRIFNCHAIFFLLHFFKNVCWGRALEISPLWCHLGSWCLSKVSDNCIFLMVFLWGRLCDHKPFMSLPLPTVISFVSISAASLTWDSEWFVMVLATVLTVPSASSFVDAPGEFSW